MKLSCLNSRKHNLCQKLSDWSHLSLKQGYQSLSHPCLQHGFSYLHLAVLWQWSHVSWNSQNLFAHLLFFRISAISANPGKVLLCLYYWAICRSWVGIEAALPNEHRLWLILIKSEFHFYLYCRQWKSILQCLAFLYLQDLYFYAEAFFIHYEFHNLYILHVFIHVLLTMVSNMPCILGFCNLGRGKRYFRERMYSFITVHMNTKCTCMTVLCSGFYIIRL